MKNKIILLLIVFFSAGIYSATAQSKQQNMKQKWQDEMLQTKKHHDEIVVKAKEQQGQLKFEKKPEQTIAPVEQNPQIKSGGQQNSQPITPVKKDDKQPVDLKKLTSENKSIKKDEIN